SDVEWPAVDIPSLRRHLAGVDVALDDDRVLFNGRDVSDEIRTPVISALTSRLTMLAPIRAKVTPLQRQMAAGGGVVLEGRDTGTVVCPDADVKFYLDASDEERARRRQAELAARGVAMAPPAGQRARAADRVAAARRESFELARSAARRWIGAAAGVVHGQGRAVPDPAVRRIDLSAQRSTGPSRRR